MQTIDEEFRLLGEDMKTAWDAAAIHGPAWDAFTVRAALHGWCARWSITGEGYVHVALEEYEDVASALQASEGGEGSSVEPLRRLVWRRAQQGWEKLA